MRPGRALLVPLNKGSHNVWVGELESAAFPADVSLSTALQQRCGQWQKELGVPSGDGTPCWGPGPPAGVRCGRVSGQVSAACFWDFKSTCMSWFDPWLVPGVGKAAVSPFSHSNYTPKSLGDRVSISPSPSTSRDCTIPPWLLLESCRAGGTSVFCSPWAMIWEIFSAVRAAKGIWVPAAGGTGTRPGEGWPSTGHPTLLPPTGPCNSHAFCALKCWGS